MVYTKGHKHSKETRRKISETHLRNKTNKGKHLSIRTEFKKGHKPWNTGIKGKEFLSHQKNGKMWHTGKKGYHIHTKKHKEELRKRMSGNKFREGLTPWNKNNGGYNLPPKTNKVKERIRKKLIGHPCYKSKIRGKNISIALKKWYIKNPKAIEEFRKRRENIKIPKIDSSIEIKIQNFLKQLGIEFFTHQHMKIEHGYQCDILIPSMNLVIECDGDYWHKYPIGLERDHIRTKELIEKGFKVLRLWERDIKKMELNDFKIKIGGN
ncbi:MAG: DUF559 domain-containing protein [Nanoarchaeota archaeon]|nr:DUF559 domain-containing protein [Nanoarchaeota archaeon]